MNYRPATAREKANVSVGDTIWMEGTDGPVKGTVHEIKEVNTHGGNSHIIIIFYDLPIYRLNYMLVEEE